MGGFPNYAIDKHLAKLLKEGFTIITIEQETHGESNPERKVTGIYSPGTNIEYNQSFNQNYLCSIVFEQHSFRKNHQKIEL